MSTCYVCTLGTSIANRLPSADGNPRNTPLTRAQRADAPWDAADEDSRAFARQLETWTTDLLRRKVSAELDGASAEMTVLAKIGARPGDRVVLLATDTFLGKVCGQQVRRVVAARFGLAEDDVMLDRVEGLQVNDARRAEQVGYGNFFESTRRRIDEANRSGYEVCICPNGGFKGVVPFLTIIGMLNQAKVVYTFEHAGTLITIPPLPFELQGEYFRRAERALRMLEDRVEMPEAAFLAMIDNYDEAERPVFLGFVQRLENGMVTPLSLLEPLIAAAKQPILMLSKQAVADMKALEGTANYGLFVKLILDAQRPQWRDSHIDTYQRSDLIGMKRGRTNERLLGYPVDDSYYVARAVGHLEYERLLNDGNAPQKKDFPQQDFVRWNPVGVDCRRTWSAVQGLSDAVEDVQRKLDIATDDLEAARQLSAETGRQLADKSAALSKTVAELADCQAACTRQETELKAFRQAAASPLGAIKLWWRNRQRERG